MATELLYLQDFDMTNCEAAVERVKSAVRHIGHFKGGSFTPGETVQCEVDQSRRDQNTRLHSAGHLIDMTVAQLGLPWTAVRGAHYPHMSFVEYEAPNVVADEQLKQRLQAEADELSTRTYQNKILFIPRAEMAQYCRHVPDNIPANKPSRIVLYADDFGIPCGGTHVGRLKDIGDVIITKIKAKKGILKVSYAVAGIN